MNYEIEGSEIVKKKNEPTIRSVQQNILHTLQQQVMILKALNGRTLNFVGCLISKVLISKQINRNLKRC